MEQKVQQYDTPPPNYSLRQHATHGFSHRPSIAQIASYLIIIFTIVIYFSCTIILNTSTPLLIISCFSLTSIIISTAIATCTDPTDRVVYYYKWSRHDKKITFAPQYDKILYCEYCDSYCWATSKHCRTCNRCVSNFDHHCMWFNNCVGKRNYTAFMVSIVSTFVFSAVVSVHVVVSSTEVEYGVKEQLGKIIPSWIAALLMTIFGFLLFNLIVLHIYLIINGMTTYQFLQKRKKEQEEEKKKKQQMDKGRQKERKNMLPPLVITGKNKVMPSHSLPQLDSIQAIDSKAVKMKEEVRSEIVQSQHESSHVKLDDLRHEQIREEVKNSNTVFVGSDSASINSRSSEYRQNIIESQHSQNDMNRSLPRFFRQNRSLKFLLSNQGQSPRKRQPQTDHFLPHQE